ASPTAPPAAAAMLAQHFDKRLARYLGALEEFVRTEGPFEREADEPAVLSARRALRRAHDRALVGSKRPTDAAVIAARAASLRDRGHRDAFLSLLAEAPYDELRVMRAQELAQVLEASVAEATELLVD